MAAIGTGYQNVGYAGAAAAGSAAGATKGAGAVAAAAGAAVAGEASNLSSASTKEAHYEKSGQGFKLLNESFGQLPEDQKHELGDRMSKKIEANTKTYQEHIGADYPIPEAVKKEIRLQAQGQAAVEWGQDRAKHCSENPGDSSCGAASQKGKYAQTVGNLTFGAETFVNERVQFILAGGEVGSSPVPPQ